MLIEALKPLRIRFKEREVHLQPGHPVTFTEEEGRKLLEKAPGKVRQLRSAEIQPGSFITWQGADGKQRGPALVDFFYTDPDGSAWAFVTLREGWAAVNLKYARVEGS